MRAKRQLGLFTVLLSAFGLFVHPTARAQYAADADFEQELLSVVNDMRAKAHLPPVAVDPRLKEAAHTHLAEFATHEGQLSHRYPDEPSLQERIGAAKVPCASGGEVLLKLPDTMTDTALRAENALETNDSRSVILNPRYSSVGFAIAHSDFYIYAAGDFISSVQFMSSEEAEKVAAKRLQQILAESKLPPI